jgi:hypothetical protein
VSVVLALSARSPPIAGLLRASCRRALYSLRRSLAFEPKFHAPGFAVLEHGVPGYVLPPDAVAARPQVLSRRFDTLTLLNAKDRHRFALGRKYLCASGNQQPRLRSIGHKQQSPRRGLNRNAVTELHMFFWIAPNGLKASVSTLLAEPYQRRDCAGDVKVKGGERINRPCLCPCCFSLLAVYGEAETFVNRCVLSC